MEKKKLLIGTESFSEIINGNYYYVDKTGFIKDLIDLGGKVNLFTRPRRFGKSLNIDMLKSFFEIGTDSSLFDGLEIANEKELCKKYMGNFPVISISLKEVSGDNPDKAIGLLRLAISEEAKRFKHLIYSDKLDKYSKSDLDRILLNNFESTADLCFSLKILSRILFEYYGKKVIVLIDEYDVPLDKAYSNGYYPAMLDIIRSLFSGVLKSNDYLHFAVITGCLQISKESIFTGLNNFMVWSVSETAYAKYFGFTDNEVETMLKYYELEEFLYSFKEWYNGYSFGGINIYCPWSVINQCAKMQISKNAPIELFWINSSSNTIIKDILENSTATTRNQIEALISGESVEKMLIPELTYTDFDSKDTETKQTYLWSVLLAAGYLTEHDKPKNKIHKLIIPNKEICEIYENQILSWTKARAVNNADWWKHFCTAVKDGDANSMETLFNQFMMGSISIRDTCSKKTMKENFYHGILLGILGTNSNWITLSNQEAGIGFTDILVKMPDEGIGCIFEVKYAENGTFDKMCQDSLKQIQNNGYTEILKQDGIKLIHKYGIACYKKTCKVVHEAYIPPLTTL